MTPEAWNVAATVGMLAFFLLSIALVVGWNRSDRENLKLRRELAELERHLDGEVFLAERRAREDADRIHALRGSLDAANSCNSHFVEWATEPPVEPIRPGGDPS